METPPSRAQFHFEKFSGENALKVLAGLPAEIPKVFEDEWLDFKSGRCQGEDVPEIWSRTLGAFANNEGGVVVWGVAAEKDSVTKVDAVTGIEPVPDVFKLKSRLQELHRHANDPPVPKVEIVALPKSPGANDGFVVCFIPESPFKPHRSENAGRRYYLRMGDSSQECSSAILRRLFHPTTSSRVRVTIRAIPPPPWAQIGLHPPTGRNDFKSAFEVTITNTGNVTVSSLFAVMNCEGGSLFQYQYDHQGKPQIDPLSELRQVAEELHPEMSKIFHLLLASKASPERWVWHVGVSSRDARPKKARLVFDAPVAPGSVQSEECL